SHARKSSFEQTRLILWLVALAVIGGIVWGLMHFMSTSGNEAASREGEAIDRAQNVQAQLTGTSAIMAVQVVYTQSGSFNQVTLGGLQAAERTFTYNHRAV